MMMMTNWWNNDGDNEVDEMMLMMMLRWCWDDDDDEMMIMMMMMAMVMMIRWWWWWDNFSVLFYPLSSSPLSSSQSLILSSPLLSSRYLEEYLHQSPSWTIWILGWCQSPSSPSWGPIGITEEAIGIYWKTRAGQQWQHNTIQTSNKGHILCCWSVYRKTIGKP